jgi:hypothetical protein
LLLGVLPLLSCNSGDATNRVVALLFDQPVTCDTSERCVSAASGLPVTGERIDVMKVLSSGASTFDPGLYLYVGGHRQGGVFFELELDIVLELGADMREIPGSYREYVAGAPYFVSDRMTGDVGFAPDPSGDGTRAGVFDLQFTDHGADDLPGTPDDRVRALRFGWFSLSGREPTVPERPETLRYDGVWVDVHEDPGYDVYLDAEGCDSTTHDTYGETSGCEGDTTSDSSGGDGCAGDSTGGGGGDCAGDSSSGGGGCAGDTGGGGGCGGGSGGCVGDAAGSPGSASRRRPNRVLRAMLPLFALLTTRALLRRR